MALPSEPSVYTGTAGVWRDSKILVSTADDYMPTFREVVFNQTPFVKALALNAFGKGDVIKGAAFGNVQSKRGSSGKGIVFKDPSYQFSFPIYTAVPTGSHIGRMGNVNPQYLGEPTSGAYAYKRLVWSIYLPEELVKDNKGKNRLADIMDREFRMTQMQVVTDINNILLGNSSAPSSSPYGLPALVSVTQSAATNAAGITPSATTTAATYYWKNQYRACTSVGGGGELDRPLVFNRQLFALLLDINVKSGSSDSKLMVGTRGAYQYYHRAAYADSTAQGNSGLRNAQYDAANIDHLVFNNVPFIYDTAVTVPTGATASTESVYVLDMNEFGLAVRRDEFLDVEAWDAPRPKDKQRFYQTNIWLRYTPFVSNRRIQGVLYNLPANPDAS